MIPALGPQWLQPEYLLDTYGEAFLWVALLIVFVECGLFFPFLPGDILLFMTGIFIANGRLEDNLVVAMGALVLAAIGGNVAGYEIGRRAGAPLRERDGRIVKRKHIARTEVFFDRYGAAALVLARFVPVVRTYITVVAGVSRMHRRFFLTWSLVGATLWVVGITLVGYLLGGVPWVRDHPDLAVLVFVVVTSVPIVVEYLRHRNDAPLSEDAAEAS